MNYERRLTALEQVAGSKEDMNKPVLQIIVHTGDDEAAMIAEARRERGLKDDDPAFIVIYRIVVPKPYEPSYGGALKARIEPSATQKAVTSL